MASPLGLRDEGDYLAFVRPKGGGWASDAMEEVARLDRLQVANLIMDAEHWLEGRREGHRRYEESWNGVAHIVVCECGDQFAGPSQVVALDHWRAHSLHG